MSDDRLAVEIRDAFDRAHEPSPGVEDRVLAAIPWDEPRRHSFPAPRLAFSLVGVLAIVMIGVLVTPLVLNRLIPTSPGSAPAGDTPAYSLATVDGSSLFIVQRGMTRPGNVLLQSKDGGRTWTARLHFAGVYDGMRMFGQDGFVWAIDLGGSNCGPLEQSCMPQRPTYLPFLYRTWDGGATWTLMPATAFPVNGIYFLDAIHGWIDSGSPEGGLGRDALYATTDGAKSWKLVGPLPNSFPNGWIWGVGKYHVTFSSVSRGWYLGDGVLFATTDGGHTWSLVGGLHRLAGTTVTYSQPIFDGQDGILPVAYRDVNGPDNATANLLTFYVTHDGGATWGPDPRSGPKGFAPVGDDLTFAILDPQHIWLTSQSVSAGDNVQAGPAVARSSDGGETWTVTKRTPRILVMIFRDATHGYALDVTGPTNTNGILSTSDAGATWQRVTVPFFV